MERLVEEEPSESEEPFEEAEEDSPALETIEKEEEEDAFKPPHATKRQTKGAKAMALFLEFMALSYLIVLRFAIITIPSKETNHLCPSEKWEGEPLL